MGRLEMKKSKLLALLFGCIILLSSSSVAQAATNPQEDPDDPVETVQVVLVIDVSQSMEELVLHEGLPEELLILSDVAGAIRSDRTAIELDQDIEGITDVPEIVAAWQARIETALALDTWLADNGYGNMQKVDTDG